MFLHQVLFLVTEVLVFSLSFSGAGNHNDSDSECVLTDIKSHLNIASQIIETAKQKIPNDLRELCKSHANYTDCKNESHFMKPVDCSDIYQNGERRDGLYNIWPQTRISKGPLTVYCDMETNGGGWTVIQRRGDYKSPVDYFYKDWNSYKIGFGDKMKDFWIGNDNLFALTNQRAYHLRFNLADWEENSVYATYNEFWVSDESFNYTLHVTGYSGTAGDSFSNNDGMQFSTKDRDNDLSKTQICAVERQGAWWYRDCTFANLNGPYNGRKNVDLLSLYWDDYKGASYSLKETVMEVRPDDFNAK